MGTKGQDISASAASIFTSPFKNHVSCESLDFIEVKFYITGVPLLKNDSHSRQK